MGPIKTTVTLKWGYMGFHVSLGECKNFFKSSAYDLRHMTKAWPEVSLKNGAMLL